jgi:hypothetical protein
MKKKRFDFAAAVTAGLKELGALEGGPYDWRIDTVGGLLDISPYDTWVACRFDDVERAILAVGKGGCNPNSGKWNWHYGSPTETDVANFLFHLRSILPAGEGNV